MSGATIIRCRRCGHTRPVESDVVEELRPKVQPREGEAFVTALRRAATRLKCSECGHKSASVSRPTSKLDELRPEDELDTEIEDEQDPDGDDENDLILRDISSDAEDLARAHEEGWFYGDTDPREYEDGES